MVAAAGDPDLNGRLVGQVSMTADGVATHRILIDNGGYPGYGWRAYCDSWGPTSSLGATSVIDGVANTALMVATSNYDYYSVAGYASRSLGWHAPSIRELEIIYYFRKPTTDLNNTGFGSNDYAVAPELISTNHTAGNPAQTGLADYQTGGSKELRINNGLLYWSSTEVSASNAYAMNFITGEVVSLAKTTAGYVKLIQLIA